MPILEETDDENGSPTLKLKQRLRQERKEIEELFKKQAGVIDETDTIRSTTNRSVPNTQNLVIGPTESMLKNMSLYQRKESPTKSPS